MKTQAYFTLILVGILFALSYAGAIPSEMPAPTEDRPLFSTFGWKTDFSK